jgi:fibronectin-binding autotransporter adhesin
MCAALSSGRLQAAVKTWDGGTNGTGTSWNASSGVNWNPNGIPTAADDILFDNTIVTTLPGTMTLSSTSITIRTLTWNTNNTSQVTTATSLSTDSVITLNGDGVNPLLSVLGTSGTLTFVGPSTMSGSGVLRFVLGASGQFHVANAGATLAINAGISEASLGFQIEKTGAGTLTLGGTNTFTGGLKITAGTINIGASANLGNVNNTTTIADGARLRWTSTNSINLADTRLFVLSSGNAVIDVADASAALGINASISGSGRLVKDGLGRLNLNNENVHTGGVAVLQGVLSIANTNRLGQIPASYVGDFILLNGGTLRMDLTTTSLSADRGFTLGAFGGTIEIADTRSVRTLAPVIGAGSLTKTGGGTFVFGNASNSYDGPTTVSSGVLHIPFGSSVTGTASVSVAGGTLRIDGTLNSAGSVTVGTGGVLTGAGIVEDPLILNDQATLSPGNSVGILTVSGATNQWNAGSSVYFEFKTPGTSDAAAGTDWDYLNLTGSTLALTGPITLRIDALQADGVTHATLASQNPFDPVAGNYHMLFVRTAGVSGFAGDTFQVQDSVAGLGVFGTGNAFTPAAGQFWVSLEGNDLYINYAAVPEPSSLLMLGVACCGGVVLRRRRHKLAAVDHEAQSAAFA